MNGDLSHSLSVFERGELPNVKEDFSDTTWREFQALATGEGDFQPTLPASAGDRFAQVSASEQLLTFIDANERVCPNPQAWHTLYTMLAKAAGPFATLPPPPPVDAAHWPTTSAAVKKMCLLNHCEWAASQGLEVPALDFLVALREDEWLHNAK
ncbi:hypothetical protein [Ramlibacter humi]|uniref:Uncharacterized protein n=1 Tax=Ramlibacter humi TaxID=2530451 RepID=A0A4Z0BGK3_9BURK|nr:hypothetical protein [Ramlibacter humi]TFY97038.1 hypothetical protein EZ216_19430 [Ramlibacter humi]